MIQYDKSAFGLNLLFRLHGSAVYRATFFGFLSVAFLLLIRLTWYDDHAEIAEEALGHPYAIGVLVASISFLLVFRVQIGYGRYWEACTNIYHMQSKWIDATTHAATYHLQCEHYASIKPPSYFDYHALNDRYMIRDRESAYECNEDATSCGEGARQDAESIKIRAVHKSIEAVRKVSKKRYVQRRPSSRFRVNTGDDSDSTEVRRPTVLMGEERLDGNWGPLFSDNKSTFFNPRHPDNRDPAGFASFQGGRTPALFLQELAHLSSLLIGVAFSTLRNDIEGAESPLGIYDPGCPWPEVDPDKDRNLFYHNQGLSSSWYAFMRFLGMGRTAEDRTRYNASRPMPILGGVSTGEIRFLQMARGPYAKTQLAWQWLSEFMIREQLAGSLGKVAPPIVSRCFQFLGDGMIYYNHARKIMFIPFPIPHAQLTAVFVLIMIPAVALLMDQYATELWLGCCLTFLACTALGGMHEVARELENPFRNVPNELPLVTLLAEANETLVTMYAGYHPDHFWKDAAEEALKIPPPRRNSSIVASSQKASEMKDALDKLDSVGSNASTSTASSTPTANHEEESLGQAGPPPGDDSSMQEQIRLLMSRIERQQVELEQLQKKVIANNSSEAAA